MPNRSADDFDAIRKHLEEIRKREGESLKTPTEGTPNTTSEDAVREDKEPTPATEDYYGCGYQDKLVAWANGLDYGWGQPFYRVGDIQTSCKYNYFFILLDDGVYPYPHNAYNNHPYIPVMYPHYYYSGKSVDF